MTSWIPEIKKLADGSEVKAANLNPMLGQLAQRDQYLYEQLNADSSRSTLIARNQKLDSAENITTYKPYVVYGDSNGLKKAVARYSTKFNTQFAPDNSSYPFGILKTLNATGSAANGDVYLYGLIKLTANIDDATLGLLQGDEEYTTPQPYYLSATEEGKLTAKPTGNLVYIGYALDRTTFFLAPYLTEFAQFFVTYNLQLLSRPIGVPELTTVWEINDPDFNKVGWVEVGDLPVNYTVPDGAKYFYWIPTFTDVASLEVLDDALDENERESTLTLRSALPPSPANLTKLHVNGILQRVYEDDENGTYKIDDFGIWWFSDEDGYQPWSEDLDEGGWEPEDWVDTKGDDLTRPYINLSFANFNPSFRKSVVTNLQPFYVDGENDSRNVLKLVNKSEPTVDANTGNLLIRFNLPTDIEAGTGSATAIASAEYNEVSGQLDIVTTPVVSSLVAGNGIQITDGDNGAKIVTSTVNPSPYAKVGHIHDIEPENVDLIQEGLNFYLKLPYTTNVNANYGYVGKFILPLVTAEDLYIRLKYFGDVTIVSSALANFDFEYVVTNNNSVINTSTTSVTGLELTVPANYSAKTVLAYENALIKIPAASLTTDSTVTFRLKRKVTNTNAYTGAINVVGTYWKLGA